MENRVAEYLVTNTKEVELPEGKGKPHAVSMEQDCWGDLWQCIKARLSQFLSRKRQ